jgi:hypothetical protein
MRRRQLLLLGLVSGLLVAPRLQAQGIELGPGAGVYLPMGSFQDPAYFTTSLPEDPSDLAALALGVHARVRIATRLGVQLEATSALSHVGGGPTPSGQLPAKSARVVLATLQATYHLTLPARRTQVWIAAGPGLVHYSGSAYSPLGSPTLLAGVAGVGASVPALRPIRAELTAGLAVYRLNLRDRVGATLERGMQFDARVTAGLSWVLH